jgi:hypothetical protein
MVIVSIYSELRMSRYTHVTLRRKKSWLFQRVSSNTDTRSRGGRKGKGKGSEASVKKNKGRLKERKRMEGGKKSRDISVGVALGYGLDGRGSRVRFLAGAGNFSLHHRFQNGSGAHPASYPWE